MQFYRLDSMFMRSFLSVSRKSFSTDMVRAKKFIYAKRFEGEPKLTDFKLVEEELPELQEGG